MPCRFTAFRILLALLALLAFPSILRAEAVVEEKFAKTELDKAWTVTKEHIGDRGEVAYAVVDGKLVVTKITYADTNPQTSSDPYVDFTRKLDKPLGGDFDAELGVGWDAAGAADENAPIQYIHLRLLDASDKVVAYAGYTDGHVGGLGRRESAIGKVVKIDESATQPANGKATVTIRRRDGKITVFWKDIEIGNGTAATPVAKIAIRAQGYYWGQEKRNLFNKVTAEKLVVKTP